MTEINSPESNGTEIPHVSWLKHFTAAFKTPLGLFGACLTTVFFVLSSIGMLAHSLGYIDNPYASILTLFLFPTGMVVGLILIPLAMFLRKKKMFKNSLTKEGFKIDFGNPLHFRNIILVIVLTCVNIAVFGVAAYEGYHYMDSPEFCGVVCHQVMAPEYEAHQQSVHSNVACVECHIAPGITGLVSAKVSGLRQLKGVLVGDYNRPVPVPVEHLPAATETCEKCHSPTAFIGTKVKKFASYSNDDQTEPDEENEIILNVGGLNPMTHVQEGIHWHNMNGLKLEYLPLNEQRTEIGNVRLTKPDGSQVLYEYESDVEEENQQAWRTMDCTDCHNRAAHIYDNLEERVDFGLMSNKLNAEIEGLREDSIAVLQKSYTSRKEAQEKLKDDLLALQRERHGDDYIQENIDSYTTAADFILESYAKNVYPALNLTWGTYKSHLGHKYEEDGFGCFRCHDDEHESKDGDYITQDCSLCHEEP